jgi:hypothetical protein
MNTDDFISQLATGVVPADRWILAKRFTLAVLVGFPGAILLVIGILGVRPDLAQAAVTPLFWAKIAFPLCLMMGALSMAMRLARPAMRPGLGMILIGVTIAAVWGLAIYTLMSASPEARVTLILGESWRVCALNITVLSIPGFVAVFWALRGLAPTRLELTGAIGGLLAGAMATSAYCLYCPEMEVPFWGFWYLMGMVVPTTVGVFLGPRWLRW